MIIRDLRASLINRDLWLYLAWQDIRLRYRRSKIGPLWITLSMAIFCVSMGAVYSQLFKANIAEYFPFLSISFIFWGLISGLLSEFPSLYIENSAYIKDIRVNPFSLLFRLTTRHLITFAHNLVIVVGAYLYFGINPSFAILMVLPALVLVVLNLLGIGVSLSLLGARFRDVAPITQSLVQVVFFITPITWFPKLLPHDSLVLKLNPIAYYLELLRAPLLGQVASLDAWLVAGATCVVFWSVSAWVYTKKAGKIPFWV